MGDCAFRFKIAACSQKDPCSCVWPAQEIKKPPQLEAYLCVNYLRAAALNKSERRFSVCSFLTRIARKDSTFK